MEHNLSFFFIRKPLLYFSDLLTDELQFRLHFRFSLRKHLDIIFQVRKNRRIVIDMLRQSLINPNNVLNLLDLTISGHLSNSLNSKPILLINLFLQFDNFILNIIFKLYLNNSLPHFLLQFHLFLLYLVLDVIMISFQTYHFFTFI